MRPGSENTKNKVIESAISLINTGGYRGTSMDDIIKATGVKKGNLYFHFSGKEELAAQVLERARDDYFSYLSRAISMDSPMANIKSLMEAVYRFHKKRGFSGGCIFGNLILELSDSNPRLASIAGSALQQWIDITKKLISDAISVNEIQTPLSPSSLAEHIVSAMEGGIMLSRIRKSGAPLRNCMENIYYMLGIKN